jgi:hypothetical protein
VRDDADALRPLQIDRVVGEQILVLVQLRGKRVEKGAHRGVKPARQILAQATDAHVARKHPKAGEHLVQVEQQLALAEAVEHHRDRAHLHSVGAEPDQMAVDPLQFGEQHADPPHALGSLQAEQLLHCQAKTERV